MMLGRTQRGFWVGTGGGDGPNLQRELGAGSRRDDQDHTRPLPQSPSPRTEISRSIPSCSPSKQYKANCDQGTHRGRVDEDGSPAVSSRDDAVAFTLRRLAVSDTLPCLAHLLTGKELLVDADHGLVVAQRGNDDVGAGMVSSVQSFVQLSRSRDSPLADLLQVPDDLVPLLELVLLGVVFELGQTLV